MEEFWRNNNRGRTQGFFLLTMFAKDLTGCFSHRCVEDDKKIEEFYDQLQNVIDQTPKKDVLVVQGD